MKAATAAATLLLTAGCQALPSRGPLAGPPLPLQPPLHKRVLQNVVPLGRITWVNEALVAFSGIPAGSEGSNRSQDLYLWPLQGPARLLRANATNPCAHAGRITAQQWLGQGRPVQLVELTEPRFRPRLLGPQRPPSTDFWDDYSCSYVSVPSALKGHRWEGLARGDGFLDLGRVDHLKRSSVRVEHLDTSLRSRDTGIRLGKEQFAKASPRSWDGSYLVDELLISPEDKGRWRQAGRRIWRLDPSFQASPLLVPGGPWVSRQAGTIQFFPSRAGLLITSNNFERGGRPGDAGAYLLPPRGRPLRLERGLVEDAALSPNGCRLAYGHQLHLGALLAQARRRLVVVDLCGPAGP